MSLLFRASTRYLLRHRAQCALAVSGIALGVAIVIAIQTTQLSARAAFEHSMTSLFGTATHEIAAVAAHLDEHHLTRVRKLVPHWHPAPYLEARIALADRAPSTILNLVGFDPFSMREVGSTADFDIRSLVREPDAAIINRATADRLGLETGGKFAVASATGRNEVTVIAIAEGAQTGTRFLADNVVLVDIATAQELLDLPGRLSRIELDARDDAQTADTLARLRAALPATLAVIDRGRDRAGAAQLTAAFYTNLDALSLLALLVGAFMIYNTMAFLVVQRQTLFARLRALGVSRAAIARQIAGEAVLLGVCGGVIGNLLGYALATVLAGPLARTLSDHYFATSGTRVAVDYGLVCAGLLLAVASALAATAIPAWQAARNAPAELARSSAQEHFAHRLLAWCAAGGCVIALLGAALLGWSSRSLYAGFAALGCILVAATVISPWLVRIALAWLARHAPRRVPLPERLAIKSASRAMGRIGMAIAALMAATATSVGVGLMVASFRTSVTDWLDQLLRAELYVSQIAAQAAQPPIDEALIASLRADARIAALSKVRRARIRTDDGEINVTAYALPPAARAGFRFLDGKPADIWPRWQHDATVIVSEPFAWRRQLAVGDTLALPTPAGPQRMTITGIYADYGSERGVVALSWSNFMRYWQDPRVHGVGIYPRAGVDVQRLQHDLQQRFAGHDQLTVFSRAELQQQSLIVFDRTFAITDVLTLFAALIAALGVFNALLALNLERAREYAVLRATGCSRALIRRSMYAQTVIVAGAATLLAIPLGVAIAVLLIEIINVRSFGWSMALSWHPAALFGPAALALACAFAATVYPAEHALRSAPASALRYE